MLSQLSVYSSSFLIFLVSLSGLYLFYGVFFSALLCNISMIFRTSGSSIICYSTLTLLSYSCYLLTMIFFFYLGLSLDTCFIEILITLWSDILSLKSSYLCRIDYGSRSLWTITSILECLFPDYQVFLSHVIIFHPSFHIQSLNICDLENDKSLFRSIYTILGIL